MHHVWRNPGVYYARFSEVQAPEGQRYGHIFSIHLSLMNTNRLDNASFLYSIIISNDYTSYETYDARLNLVGEWWEQTCSWCQTDYINIASLLYRR